MNATWTNNDIKSLDEVLPLQVNSSSSDGINNWCSNTCTLKLLKRRLPIVAWLPKYNLEDMKGDLIAGMTVALTVIPQGLALALLAGLPPQYGLYTAFMGCFMYTLFGSCKDLTIGPTAIMSIMTAEHAAAGGITYVILITFLSGCIQLVMGILNLGFLVTFISASVVSGFTSAAAITIAMTQLAGIFGLYFKSENFISDVYHFFYGIVHGNIRYYDMAMGLSSVLFLLLLKYGSKLKLNCSSWSTYSRIMGILLQTICTARNALLVLICAGVAATLLSYDINALTLTQQVKPGLPSFAFPVFSYSYFNNATNQTVHKDFIHIVKDMGSGLVIMPLLCILEAIAIAKSFAKGKKLDATQEMIAIGVCNIMGSFVSSYPATGSFSRTAINYSSGVRTTAGGIVTVIELKQKGKIRLLHPSLSGVNKKFHKDDFDLTWHSTYTLTSLGFALFQLYNGSLVLLALGVMSPYFQFIPKASLSALIFIAVLNMVHYKDVIIMWKTNKMDLLPFSTTFIFSFVLGLEYGIIIGIGTSVCLLLLQESRPKIVIEEKKTFLGCSYLYVKPDRTIFFPSAEILQTKIIKAVPEKSEASIYTVLIDGLHLTTADYTMAMCMKALIDSCKKENINVIFINLKPDVQKVIKGVLPTFTEFFSKEDAENYIEAISVSQSSPPAYNIDSQSLRSDDISFNGPF